MNISFRVTPPQTPPNQQKREETDSSMEQQFMMFQTEYNSDDLPKVSNDLKRKHSDGSADYFNAKEEPDNKKAKLEENESYTSYEQIDSSNALPEIFNETRSPDKPVTLNALQTNELFIKLKSIIIDDKLLDQEVFLSEFNKLSPDLKEKLVEYYRQIIWNYIYVNAIIYLGLIYSKSDDFKDIPQAVILFEKAANAAYPVAMFNLGSLYAKEPEVKNIDKAIHWLTQSAYNGYLAAMPIVSDIFKKNHNIEMAISWLEHYPLIDKDQMYKLGKFYKHIDLEKSFNWCIKAADHGLEKVLDEKDLLFEDVDQAFIDFDIDKLIDLYIKFKRFYSVADLYCREPSIRNIDKAIEYLEKVPNSNDWTNKELIKELKKLDTLPFLQNEKTRKELGLILNIFNIFHKKFLCIVDCVQELKDCFNNYTLKRLFSNKQFLLNILKVQATNILDISEYGSTLLKPEFKKFLDSFVDFRCHTKTRILLSILIHRFGNNHISLSGLQLKCQDLDWADLTLVDLSNTQLEGSELKNVRLNIDQIEQFEQQGIKLIDFTISYQSVYNKLYQTYKLLFAVNKDDSLFNIIPAEVKKMQLAVMLITMIEEVQTRGGIIERTMELDRWIEYLYV